MWAQCRICCKRQQHKQLICNIVIDTSKIFVWRCMFEDISFKKKVKWRKHDNQAQRGKLIYEPTLRGKSHDNILLIWYSMKKKLYFAPITRKLNLLKCSTNNNFCCYLSLLWRKPLVSQQRRRGLGNSTLLSHYRLVLLIHRYCSLWDLYSYYSLFLFYYYSSLSFHFFTIGNI